MSKNFKLGDNVKHYKYPDSICTIIALVTDDEEIKFVLIDKNLGRIRGRRSVLDTLLKFEDDCYVYNCLTGYENCTDYGMYTIYPLSLIEPDRAKKNNDNVSDLGKFLSGIDKVKNHKSGNSGLEFL